MKKYLFLASMFVLEFAFGQTLMEGMKYTSIEFNNDSSIAVIAKGKKMGLYDVKNQKFIFKPSKLKIIPSFNRNWYVFIGNKGLNIYEHGTFAYKPASDYSIEISGFSIKEIDDERILIQDYGFTLWDPDKYGDERLIQIGHQNSGLYNIKNDDWEIPAIYERIYEINNKFICRKDDSIWVEKEFLDDGYSIDIETYDTHYDLYSITEESTTQEPSITNNSDGLKAIFDENLVSIDGDYIVLREDNLVGAMRFNLFQTTDGNYSFLDTATILKTQHKFVHFSIDQVFIGLQTQSDSVHLFMYDPEKREYNELCRGAEEVNGESSAGYLDRYLVDDFFYDDLEGKDYWMRDHLQYGISVLPNNRIKLTNYLRLDPLQAYDEYGEQAYDMEGAPVFMQDGEIIQKAGVYNLASNSWEVPQLYLDVTCLPNQRYLVKEGLKVESDGDYGIKMTASYHLLDKDLNLIDSKNAISDFWADDNFIKMLDGRGDDVIIITGPKIKDYEGHDIEPIHHLTSKDGRMKVFSEQARGNDFYKEFEADFIYNNQKFPYWISLDKEQWTLHFSDTSLLLDDASKPLEIHHAKGGECRSVIQVSSTNDTTVLFKYDDNPACDRDKFPAIMTLTKIGDSIIIVSDFYQEEYEKIDYWGEEYFAVKEDYAGSAIWKKDKNGNWNLASPYYAKIDVLENGYITKTRKFDGCFVYDQNGEGFAKYDENGFLKLRGVEEERYIWLNEKFEAKPFLDYYDFSLIEDLGFGMKVCSDKGCMLVTYSGIALTNDVWAEFRIDEDRIYGTKLIPIEYDPIEFDAVEILFEILRVADLKK
jgi:hypothetical protein